MCTMSIQNHEQFFRQFKPTTDFYLVVVSSGFQNSADIQLGQDFSLIVERFPKTVLLAHLFLPEECRSFLDKRGLHSRSGPLIVISEENPFEDQITGTWAVLEIGELHSSDEIKQVLSSLSSLASHSDFANKAKFGEALRRIERKLGKFGGPFKDCLSIVGVG